MRYGNEPLMTKPSYTNQQYVDWMETHTLKLPNQYITYKDYDGSQLKAIMEERQKIIDGWMNSMPK